MSFGLGRGLEALIPNKKPARAQTVTITQPKVSGSLEVPIDKILPNPHQPRKHFNLIKLQELAESIKEHGLLEPIVVSPSSTEGSYVLVAGERRLRAAELAGMPKISVVVRPANDQEKLELALVENIQRQDLNPIEEARALRKLIRDFQLSQNEVAKKVGRSRPAVANCLRLLELAPEAQKAVLDEKISSGHAKALLGLSNQTKQVEILRQVLDLNMSVRDTERLVKKVDQAKAVIPSKQVSDSGDDPEAAHLSKELSQSLGTRVQVVSAPKGGRIVIEYYSKDERKRVVDQILKKSAGKSTGDSNHFSV